MSTLNGMISKRHARYGIWLAKGMARYGMYSYRFPITNEMCGYVSDGHLCLIDG